jgi:hypothetical protein
MQVETLDTAVIDYINEIKANCEQQIQAMQQQCTATVQEIIESSKKEIQ